MAPHRVSVLMIERLHFVPFVTAKPDVTTSHGTFQLVVPLVTTAACIHLVRCLSVDLVTCSLFDIVPMVYWLDKAIRKHRLISHVLRVSIRLVPCVKLSTRTALSLSLSLSLSAPTRVLSQDPLCDDLPVTRAGQGRFDDATKSMSCICRSTFSMLSHYCGSRCVPKLQRSTSTDLDVSDIVILHHSILVRTFFCERLDH